MRYATPHVKGTEKADAKLADKIKKGGAEHWGANVMPSADARGARVGDAEAKKLAQWVLAQSRRLLSRNKASPRAGFLLDGLRSPPLECFSSFHFPASFASMRLTSASLRGSALS